MIVDVHLIGLGHSLGLTDNAFQLVKFIQFYIVKFQELIIVQAVVLKSVAHHAFHIDLLQLLQHTRHIKFVHARAFNGNDRAEVEEVAHRLTVVLRGLASLGGNLGGLGKHFQRAVWREIEHVALLLHPSVDGGRRLHAEDGLHIAGCRRII